MDNLNANPFKFGDPVERDDYLSRPELAKAVTQFLGNHIHVVLIGPRSFEKASFVWNLLKEFEKQSYDCLFVDIFNITSHRDFLQQMHCSIRPKSPMPVAGFKDAIQDMLEDLQKLGNKVIVAIDEFQKITEFDDGGWLEATLRIHMQQLRNVTFLFTGSDRDIIYDMLNNPARPLYRFCQPIELP